MLSAELSLKDGVEKLRSKYGLRLEEKWFYPSYEDSERFVVYGDFIQKYLAPAMLDLEELIFFGDRVLPRVSINSAIAFFAGKK